MGMLETTYREFNLPRRGASEGVRKQCIQLQTQSNADLESLIDEAGRDAVFAYARAAGWSLARPPEEWVWRQMAYEVLRIKAATSSAPAPATREGD